MVMAPICDSTVSHCFLAYLQRHFSAKSPPSHALSPFLHSQQQHLPWNCSTIPRLQLSAAAPSRGLAVLSGLCLNCCKDCLILIPFRLSQVSYFTFGLKCFSSHLDSCSHAGIRHLLQFSHPPRACPVLVTHLFFPLSSFTLQSFAWFYILLSVGQVLLSSHSWCSASTSVSKGVFLMCPWREIYSTFIKNSDSCSTQLFNY